MSKYDLRTLRRLRDYLSTLIDEGKGDRVIDYEYICIGEGEEFERYGMDDLDEYIKSLDNSSQ